MLVVESGLGRRAAWLYTVDSKKSLAAAVAVVASLTPRKADIIITMPPIIINIGVMNSSADGYGCGDPEKILGQRGESKQASKEGQGRCRMISRGVAGSRLASKQERTCIFQ